MNIPNIMMNDIIKIATKGSFSLDERNNDEQFMLFATRENGDVGEEEYSEIDFKEAESIEKELKEKYAKNVVVDIDTCDEWVHIEVTLLLKKHNKN